MRHDKAPFHIAVTQYKRTLVRNALNTTTTITDAAKQLGLHRTYMYRLIRDLGMMREVFNRRY